MKYQLVTVVFFSSRVNVNCIPCRRIPRHQKKLPTYSGSTSKRRQEPDGEEESPPREHWFRREGELGLRLDKDALVAWNERGRTTADDGIQAP